jgi:peptidoglycan hydrolase CwlO-like protein/surface antigen
MKKQKTRVITLLNRTKVLPVLVVVAVIAIGATSVQIVRADSIQQQIDSLSQTNSQTQQSVNSLQIQASSYQDAINKLSTQISSIQAAIAASTAKQASLQGQINIDQAKLTQEKQVLGDDIKSMYVNGTMTTVEMLATSNNLSSFVDAETYRGAVQTKIQGTLTEISNLENSLESQKNLVDQLLNTQQTQQSTLNSDESEQSNLLAMNQTQQATYDSQIKANQSKISALEAQQAAINEANSSAISAPASGGVGGACATPNYPINGTYYYSGSTSNAPNGGYPMAWCNSTQDSVTTAGGFPSRECTSFAYWYFTTIEGHSGLHVTGNADEWNTTASGPGIYVDQTPADGAVAVDTSGPFGHVMIVVATPGQVYSGNTVPNGEIDTISMNDDYNGHFFAMQRSSAGFYYIH